MKFSTFLKIAHGVFGALGAFHIYFGTLLDDHFQSFAPTAPNAATGETFRWTFQDDNDFTRVVYITDADHEKWVAFNVVGVVLLLLCGALTLYLMRLARREGRTTIY